MGLILDSSVVVAAERRGEKIADFLRRVAFTAGIQDAALSSVGLTELVHGIYRGETTERRMKRKAFLDELLSVLTVYPYTVEVAVVAGRIDGEQQGRGVKIPFADLLIGATALSLGFPVLTINQRHFSLIPGLKIISF